MKFFPISALSDEAFRKKILRYVKYYPGDLLRLAKFFSLNLLLAATARSLSDEDYIVHLYRSFTHTTPTPDELAFYLEKLANGSATRRSLIVSFLMVPADVEQSLFQGRGIISHHVARLEVVQKCLPAAKTILDLGGASPHHLEGSLLAMGYPHRPETLYIVDLPFEQRVFASPVQPIGEFVTEQGTRIVYRYASMTDLSSFEDSTIDLVWSGQSIEHISEADGDRVLAEILRVLKPGGSLCLDTPNRLLTLLQIREGFVHPEHKIEYAPAELIQKVTKAGFKITAAKAVSPMPFSLRTQRFNRLEFIDSVSLNDRPEEGYSFFLHCQKPLN